MKKLLYHMNRLWLLTFIGIMFYQLIVNGQDVTLSKNLTVLSIIIVCIVPWLIKKVLKYEMSETLKFIYFLFVFIALILGSIYNLYRTISWFDLLAHFLSGIVTCVLALIILKKFDLLKKDLPIFHIVFIIAFSLMIASFWEFFEFLSDKVLKGDTQWVLLTGVDDTMTDMLIAFLSSVIFSVFYYIGSKTNKKFIKGINKVL